MLFRKKRFNFEINIDYVYVKLSVTGELLCPILLPRKGRVEFMIDRLHKQGFHSHRFVSSTKEQSSGGKRKSAAGLQNARTTVN